ncbi:hypothetical protein [Proteus phage RP7]|nr:hypothetical protein [Proteus phage RP7]
MKQVSRIWGEEEKISRKNKNTFRISQNKKSTRNIFEKAKSITHIGAGKKCY